MHNNCSERIVLVLCCYGNSIYSFTHSFTPLFCRYLLGTSCMSGVPHNPSTVTRPKRQLTCLGWGRHGRGIKTGFLEEIRLKLPSKVSVEISEIQRAKIVGRCLSPYPQLVGELLEGKRMYRDEVCMLASTC